jgi:hypothetical protein
MMQFDGEAARQNQPGEIETRQGGKCAPSSFRVCLREKLFGFHDFPPYCAPNG